MKNWKTTLAGLFMLLGIVGKDLGAGKIDPATDFAGVMGAVGLIAAKDHNVTGGTEAQ